MLKPSGPTLVLFRVWRWGPVRFTAPGYLGTTSAYDTWRRLTPHYKVPTAVANNNWVALENFRSNIGTRKLPICRSTRVLWGLLGVSDIWFCIPYNWLAVDKPYAYCLFHIIRTLRSSNYRVTMDLIPNSKPVHRFTGFTTHMVGPNTCHSSC